MTGSEHQRSVEVEHRLGADMLHPAAAVGAEAVEAQAVRSRVDLVHQPRPQRRPLRRIDLAFEHRVLHALAEIQAGARHPAQAAPAAGVSVLTS